MEDSSDYDSWASIFTGGSLVFSEESRTEELEGGCASPLQYGRGSYQ